MIEPLSEPERLLLERALNSAMSKNRTHVVPGGLLATAVEEIVEARTQAKQAAIVDTIFTRAHQAFRNWTLGSMAGTVSTTLLGLAHDLDHPDCADTTVRHLGNWQRDWHQAMHPTKTCGFDMGEGDFCLLPTDHDGDHS